MEDLGGKGNPNLSMKDNDFFKTITVANETEIQSSQLALTQSSSQDVRTFAQRMIDDHRLAEQKVGALAADKAIVLPTKLDSDHQSMIDDLKNKSGADFDQAYVKLQVQAHKDTIAADQDEADNGNDPAVKSLASQMLGTLQHHLQMAQALQGQTM
jgi:putative membrane protein